MAKIKNLSITNHINSNFRTFALYTLENRGIPNFYDGLTNVQRIILLNTPIKYVKTLSVVGNCFNAGYHHGDSSLGGAISRLAKNYGCSYSLLNGDGFFGNTVKSEAASPRYTSVALDKKIHELISKYNFLNEKSEQDSYLPLHLDFPLGLLTTILGIAVGYKTTILPRKLEEIEKFILGKKANLEPYYKNFNGKITSFEDSKNAWLFEGTYTLVNNVLNITSIPPMMNYKSFIEKLDKAISNNSNDVTILNNSKDEINIIVTFRNNIIRDELIEKIIKLTKQIVRENLVFIKDSSVLEYDSIENYLIDYRNYRKKVVLKNYKYQLNYHENEKNYLIAMLEFFKFMKSKVYFVNKEIEDFLNKYPKEINERLSRILLKNLNKDEEESINNKINEHKQKIDEFNKLILQSENDINKTDFSLHTRNIISKLIESEDVNEINNIEVFKLNEEEEDLTDDDN